MVQFIDPRGHSAVQPEAYDLGVNLEGGLSVAFLANGFPDSDTFLGHVAEVMAEAVAGLGAEHFNKGNASVPASEEMLGQIANRCQAAVAAYGH